NGLLTGLLQSLTSSWPSLQSCAWLPCASRASSPRSSSSSQPYDEPASSSLPSSWRPLGSTSLGRHRFTSVKRHTQCASLDLPEVVFKDSGQEISDADPSENARRSVLRRRARQQRRPEQRLQLTMTRCDIGDRGLLEHGPHR